MGVKGQICAMTCGHRSTCMPRLPHAAVEMVKEKFSTLTLDAVTLNEEIDDAAGKLKLLILSMK